MSFYTDLASTASQLIREFGASASLKTITQGAYDNATSKAVTTETTVGVSAVVFPGAGYRYLDGSQVQEGDQYGFIAASGVNPPKVGDTITWSGAPLGVIKASVLAPAGINVLYEVGLRG
jgi:hypothetical protein